jgi:hypothetical protein
MSLKHSNKYWKQPWLEDPTTTEVEEEEHPENDLEEEPKQEAEDGEEVECESALGEYILTIAAESSLRSCLDVARRIFSLLDIHGRLEEYALIEGSFHLNDSAGARSEDASCIVRVGMLTSPPHYVLLLETPSPPDSSIGLRDKNPYFYFGVLPRQIGGQRVGYCSVQDHGQYPWGQDKTGHELPVDGTLRKICLALGIGQAGSKSPSNCCTLVHVLVGLIESKATDEQTLLDSWGGGGQA